MPDLTFIPTDELITELKQRYPLGLLMAGVYETPGGSELETFQIEYANGLTTAIGLAVRARSWLLAEAMTPSEEEDRE